MSSDKNTTRKKPAKGFYVPSRYKQASEASSQSSQSKEKSPQDTTRFRAHSPQRKIDFSGQSTLRSKSVESSRYGGPKKFTSTPAIQGRHELPAINASSITDASGFLCVPKRNPKTGSTSAGNDQTFLKNKTRCQSSKASGPLRSSQRNGSESNSANLFSTAESNILYAEYLQAKLLESNAIEASQKRSRYVLEKIHSLWCLMQSLMLDNTKIRKNLELSDYLIRLHEHLRKQEEMLVHLPETISVLENQYESIAKAVDTVRHKLEVKDMSLPDSGSEGEVILLLLKISDLVKSLNCIRDSDEIISAAGVADTFVQQGNNFAEEIKRAENLLSEANDLLLDETSLNLALPNQL